jgi:hypothetical protein
VSEPQPPDLPVEPVRSPETEEPRTSGDPETPQAPQPFGAAPAEPRVGGCGKPALIGCGIVFLLLGVGGITLVLNAKSLLAWFLAQAKPTILANAGADVTAEDRARFERAFDASLARIREGKIDPVGLQAVQGQLSKAVEKPGVPRETFLALTEAFEKMGGVAAPETVPPEAAPGDALPPTPPPTPPASRAAIPLPTAA